jgi:GNAT superfamily N-acetyltransferase
MAPGARTVELADGATIRVRPVEPTDADALAEAFERLSPDSRYRRFMSATPRLSSRTLAYLVDVDHVDHEALVALDAETEEGVGIARYIRLAETPDTAEVAVTVADDWHRRGVGTVLVALSSTGRGQRASRASALSSSPTTGGCSRCARSSGRHG